MGNVVYDGPEGGGVLLTGPISGTVVLKDGTVYDVTPEYITHAPGHAGPIMHHIHKLHGEKYGLHVCSELCGDERDA